MTWVVKLHWILQCGQCESLATLDIKKQQQKKLSDILSLPLKPHGHCHLQDNTYILLLSTYLCLGCSCLSLSHFPRFLQSLTSMHTSWLAISADWFNCVNLFHSIYPGDILYFIWMFSFVFFKWKTSEVKDLCFLLPIPIGSPESHK